MTPTLPKGVKRQYPAPAWVHNHVQKELTRSAAVDYFQNTASRLGWQTPSLPEATQYQMVRLSYDYWLLIVLYRNHWISRRIVDVPAGDIVKAWPRVISDISPDDITKMERVVRDTQTKTNLRRAIEWSRLFGGAGGLIVIDGHEKILDEPVDLETVEPGSYRGVIPFDRWVGVVPEGEVCSDITKPLQFNLPEYYRVQSPTGSEGFRVHASRILRFLGPSVPTPEYQAQQYWGISVLEPAYEEIRKRDNMSWNILGLTFRAQLISLKEPMLAQMLSGAGMTGAALQRFNSSMQAVNDLMSNQSMIITGKDGGMDTTNYSFTGMAETYAQFQMDIAGAAQIPVTRLFGRTLTGLGQSNDADERIYEESIATWQDDNLRPQLDLLYRVIAMSELGELPDDIELQFPSVRVLDEKEKSDLAKTTGDNILGFFSAGLFNKPMALKEVKQSAPITGFGSNVTDEDIKEAEAEQEEVDKLGLPPPGQELAGDDEGDDEGEPVAASKKVERKEKKPAASEKKDAKSKAKPKGKTKATDGQELYYIDLYIGSDDDRIGIPIAIEYPAGSRRTLHNEVGDVVYDRALENAYGYIRHTLGRDGDEIDCIIGPDHESGTIWIADFEDLGPDVDQREDEDKMLIGFKSQTDAVEAFGKMYPRDWLRGIRSVPVKDYRDSLLGAMSLL